MKTQNFYYAVFAFLVLVFCAVTAARVFADEVPGLKPKKKKHSKVMITADMIRDYQAKRGARMELTFWEAPGGHVKLKLTGYTASDSVCLEENLETVENNVIRKRNVEFGTITKDENGVPLHQIFAAGPPQDWILTPEPYDSEENHVSYRVSTNTRAASVVGRLNPSPPAE